MAYLFSAAKRLFQDSRRTGSIFRQSASGSFFRHAQQALPSLFAVRLSFYLCHASFASVFSQAMTRISFHALTEAMGRKPDRIFYRETSFGSFPPAPSCRLSSTRQWLIPGTACPSLKLVLESKAPVGANKTRFHTPSSSIFRI